MGLVFNESLLAFLAQIIVSKNPVPDLFLRQGQQPITKPFVAKRNSTLPDSAVRDAHQAPKPIHCRRLEGEMSHCGKRDLPRKHGCVCLQFHTHCQPWLSFAHHYFRLFPSSRIFYPAHPPNINGQAGLPSKSPCHARSSSGLGCPAKGLSRTLVSKVRCSYFRAWLSERATVASQSSFHGSISSAGNLHGKM